MKDDNHQLTKEKEKAIQNLETLMKETRVPIIAAVVVKSLSKRIFNIQQQEFISNTTRPEIIQKSRRKYDDSGYENEGQVIDLGDVVSLVSFTCLEGGKYSS